MAFGTDSNCSQPLGNLVRGRGRGEDAPLCDIPSGCCSFTGPWTVTRSSLRMLRLGGCAVWASAAASSAPPPPPPTSGAELLKGSYGEMHRRMRASGVGSCGVLLGGPPAVALSSCDTPRRLGTPAQRSRLMRRCTAQRRSSPKGGRAPRVGTGRYPPLCDIPSGCCSFTGPWTVTRSSLRMLRRVAAFCRPLRPVLLLVSFPRSRSPVVGVLGLCWMWHDVPFGRQRRPVVGVLRVVLVVAGVVWLCLLSTHLRPQAIHNLPLCAPPPPNRGPAKGPGVWLCWVQAAQPADQVVLGRQAHPPDYAFTRGPRT